MSEAMTAALKAWQDADAQACDTERQLTEVWEHFNDGVGPPPTSEIVHKVFELRAYADERLATATLMLNVDMRKNNAR